MLKIKIQKVKEQNAEFEIIPKARSSKKILPYVLFIIFSVVAIYNNIFAKSPDPQEFGKNAVLSKVIPQNQNDVINTDEIIEETGPAYIGNSNNLGMLQYTNPQIGQNSQDNTENNVCMATTENESFLFATDITSNAIGQSMYRNKIVDYVVQNGDTISGIAHKFNISAQTILWSNNLTLRSVLKPGTTLKILPSTGVLHTVKRGETILAIANKYKADAQKILEANGLSSMSQIKIGQELIIPDGIRPTASVVYTAPSKTISQIGNIISPIPQAAKPNSATKLLWPTAARRITQYYGWRHTGVDIAGPIGTAIYAADDGIVETAGWNKGGYGYYIIINHGNGIRTLYGHASKLLVSKGETVARGQVIMLMGSTGRSTGPHLHFEVRLSSGRTNPLSYIR